MWGAGRREEDPFLQVPVDKLTFISRGTTWVHGWWSEREKTPANIALVVDNGDEKFNRLDGRRFSEQKTISRKQPTGATREGERNPEEATKLDLSRCAHLDQTARTEEEEEAAKKRKDEDFRKMKGTEGPRVRPTAISSSGFRGGGGGGGYLLKGKTRLLREGRRGTRKHRKVVSRSAMERGRGTEVRGEGTFMAVRNGG